MPQKNASCSYPECAASISRIPCMISAKRTARLPAARSRTRQQHVDQRDGLHPRHPAGAENAPDAVLFDAPWERVVLLGIPPGYCGAPKTWPRGIEFFVIDGDLLAEGPFASSRHVVAPASCHPPGPGQQGGARWSIGRRGIPPEPGVQVRRLFLLLFIASLTGCSYQHPPAPYSPLPSHSPVTLPGSPDLI
ncbi:MAG: hypothetical protein JOY71_02830 [Acetobacteraceae bacterium]|nr:hypothetical protein [Acetobacteraceae bacterium]